MASDDWLVGSSVYRACWSSGWENTSFIGCTARDTSGHVHMSSTPCEKSWEIRTPMGLEPVCWIALRKRQMFQTKVTKNSGHLQRASIIFLIPLSPSITKHKARYNFISCYFSYRSWPLTRLPRSTLSSHLLSSHLYCFPSWVPPPTSQFH